MKARRHVASLVVTMLVLSGCASGAQTTAPVPSGPPTSELRVGLLEYRLALSAGTLKPGPVSAVVTNAGSSEHDLRFRQGGKVLGATAMLSPGGQEVLRVEVAAGAPVELDCTVTGHAEAGMHATLSVAS